MSNKIIYALIKTESYKSSNSRRFIERAITEADILILRRRVFILGQNEFNFLRRASLTKPYIDELRTLYLDKEHELLELSLAEIPNAEMLTALQRLKDRIRKQLTKNFLVNGIHIPDPEEITIESDYFSKLL